MNKEFEFLNTINKIVKSDFTGNDCAYLEEYNLAISQDSLIEDVHFSFDYMTPYEVARKALLVNVSDILASGAKPEYFSIGLSGKLNNEFVEEFYKGIKDVSSKYNLKLLGGDLTSSDKIMISITILGNYKNRKVSYRNSAKKGYIAAVCGEFGSSAKGLEDLKNGIKDNYFIQIHKNPILYPEISSEIASKCEEPYAMMDSSDGLFDCLYQISQKSKVKINIDYSKIPCRTENKEYVLYGGEDYCLVCLMSEKDFKKISGLTQIGIAQEGEGVYIDNIKADYKSYNHFS